MFSVFSGSPFDTLVDEATSELIPGACEDLQKNLEICDHIKGRAVPPTAVVKALKRRLLHYNPNVQLLAVKLCDFVVKNGGKGMAREMAGREFVDCMLSLIASASTNQVVRDAAMSGMEQWSFLFAQHPDLRFLPDQLAVFKRDHPAILFPTAPADLAIDTMAECEEAPEWRDSAACQRCLSAFTLTNRKHHCRACGGCFCGQCAGRVMPIVRFGYTVPVRVCDACFYGDKQPPQQQQQQHQQQEQPGSKEVDDFNLAIQLSLREKEAAAKYDEEAALQAAIEASKQHHQHQPQTTATKPRVVSAVERENIHLFTKLVHASGPHYQLDEDMRRLWEEMRAVKLRIEQALLVGGEAMDRMERADLTRLKRVLEEAESLIAGAGGASASARVVPPDKANNDADAIKDLLGL